MAVHMLFELVLPIVLYYVLRGFVSPLLALLLAGVPTAIAVVVKGYKERKVDMMGVLMLMAVPVARISHDTRYGHHADLDIASSSLALPCASSVHVLRCKTDCNLEQRLDER
ncbi:hypothetical protein G6F42_028529 [Rhizopus arrhizus]|nr:hypothetical protein G6F42_028529 [Rhizopus arrhizus]